MATDPTISTSFSPGRRWSIGFNVGLSVLSLFAVVVMVNYLSSRHFKRGQWMADERYRLSPLTLKVLDSLTNRVKAVVFFDPQEERPYGFVKGLLTEYELACPRLDVEYVDYLRTPGRAAAVKGQYKLSAREDRDLVIFDCNGKWKTVYPRDLFDFDMSGAMTGQPIKRTAFKGERLFTSAIASVNDPRQFKAYYLQGHGEHDPESEDDSLGYWRFKRLLGEKNVVMGTLSLVTNDVPSDCQLLIVAGPRQALAAIELERISDYLKHGGRAMILFTSPVTGARLTGLESLLADWGVEVGDNFVSDRSEARTEQAGLVYINNFGPHPVVAPLVGSQIVMIWPRSVRQLTAASRTVGNAKVAELAFTSPSGTARRSRTAVETNGVIPLIAAVEKGAIQGLNPDRGSTRLVVVGDSSFLAGENIEGAANHDFANLAVNWLLDRTQLLAIGPRPIKSFQIGLTASQMTSARWVLLAGLPGAVMLIGLTVWFRRRH